jgi:hypothetical protein
MYLVVAEARPAHPKDRSDEGYEIVYGRRLSAILCDIKQNPEKYVGD